MYLNKHEILIVDDMEENLIFLGELLDSQGYRVHSATSGDMALKLAEQRQPDLILLDIKMPMMDGYEVCRRLKRAHKTASIPVIFISVLDKPEEIVKGFEVGGVDYVVKPFESVEVLARVGTHLQLKDYRQRLEEQLMERHADIYALNQNLSETQQEIVIAMAMVAGMSSDETPLHASRVAAYSYLLAKLYGLDDETAKLIESASPMHDIGKAAISDCIINKTDPLTEDERQQLQQHSAKGWEVFNHSAQPLLQMAAIIAHQHHENWDGSGYPQQLQGEEIHIAARIVAIADVFDAVTHKRCYAETWSIEKAIDYIQEQSGKKFDASLVGLFVRHQDEFTDIWTTHQEES